MPALAAAVCLTAIHLFAGRLRLLRAVPRSRWLSLAGGGSLAYTFVHLLPELARSGIVRRQAASVGPSDFVPYAVALAGLAIFYALEQLAAGELRNRGEDSLRPSTPVFWIHQSSFLGYSMLIGYLLVQREIQGPWAFGTFLAAMSLHLFVNDHGLQEKYGSLYRRLSRFLLAGAVLAGWLLGELFPLGEPDLALPFSFLAGGAILNVIKEELPGERRSRILPFLLGAAVYALVLIAGNLAGM